MSSTRNKKIKAVVDYYGDLATIENQVICEDKLEFDVSYESILDDPQLIQHIFFENCLFKKFPTGNNLSSMAPKFYTLHITKGILAAPLDLKEYDNLQFLDITQTGIEELPSDLFNNTPNLPHIAFAYNKIKFIGENILTPLRNLKSFDLRGNPGIDVLYDERNFKETKFKVPPTAILSEFKAAIKRCVPVRISINGTEFKVLKELLVDNSPHLANLIAQNKQSDTLELKDILEATFKEILNFMHTKQPPKSTANLFDLYAASGHLQMKELNDFCAKMLMKKVTPQNAMEVLSLSDKFQNLELQKKAHAEYEKSLEK